MWWKPNRTAKGTQQCSNPSCLKLENSASDPLAWAYRDMHQAQPPVDLCGSYRKRSVSKTAICLRGTTATSLSFIKKNTKPYYLVHL